MTTSGEIANIIDAALFFAERGIRVFPVVTNGKTPAVKQWQNVASADQSQAVIWWAQEYRGFNLGVVADDLIVLDVDTIEHGQGGKDGPASLERLEAENERLPSTFTVRTASGGLHLYFRDRSGSGDTFTKGADKFGPDYPGLDLQTKNAYLVGPFSTTPSGQYQIMSAADIADLPDWLRLRIRDQYRELPAPRPRKAHEPVNNRYVSSAIAGELQRLDDLQAHGWNGAPWDQTTFEVAANLVEISNGDGSDYSLATAYSDFMAHAPMDEKFGARQHEAKWNSAVRKVGGSGRVFPAPRDRGTHTGASTPMPPAATIDTTEGAEHPPAEDEPEPTSAVIGPPSPPEESAGPGPDQDPADYFGKHGFRVEYMAHLVKDGFGLGPDGELWLYQDGIYQPDDLELLRRVTQRLSDRYRPGHYNACKDFVRALPGLPVIRSEVPDARYIIMANGVYDWQNLAMLEHSPKYRAITKLPVVFDAEAECPEFDRYLSEVVPEDTIPLVWELLGYLLMFGNPLQLAIILNGPGGNGKSTFLNVIMHLLGETNVSALSLRQMTEDRFALAGLVGKTANLAGDIDSKYLGDASRFKQVTGGDLIEVERKFGQPFSFRPYAVPVFSANEFWKTGDTTHGYWRRWLPIPFPYSVQGKRPLVEADLFAETSGIFNRAMVGLRTLMARGKFAEPKSVVELREHFEAAADVIADWFDEDAAISINDLNEAGIKTARTDVYHAFQNWCRSTGHKGMASTNFYKRLGQLGYQETKYRGTRCIVGLEVSTMAYQGALEGV